MSKKRNIRVDDLRKHINLQLQRTDDVATPSYKEALCDLIEHVLHRSGLYGGYYYNYWMDKGWREWVEAGKPTDHDPFIFGPTGDPYNRHYYGV